jgi:predicted permease
MHIRIRLSDLLSDIRYTSRLMRKDKVLTIVIVASLACAIGANIAVFSVIDSILLRSLPVSQPEKLILVELKWKEWPRSLIDVLAGDTRKDEKAGISSTSSLSEQVYLYLRTHTAVFSELMAFMSSPEKANVAMDDAPYSAEVCAVSGNFFNGLGVPAVVGRALSPGDDQASSLPVAMVSFSFWQQHLGGSESAIGKTIFINGSPVTLIGVAPRAFFGMEPGVAPDIWITLAEHAQQNARILHQDVHDAKMWYIDVFGKLKPGTTQAQARSEMQLLGAQMFTSTTQERAMPWLDVASMQYGIQNLRYEFSNSLLLLAIMAAFLLLIACANVAGLLLAKSGFRRSEIAIRLSLGASKWNILRQLMMESIFLALLAGALGSLFGRWVRTMLTAFIESGRGIDSIPPQSDVTVAFMTAAISVASGVLFGLLPSLQSMRMEIAPVVKHSANGTSSTLTGRSGWGRLLVSSQVALSLVLLIGAGLFLRTLQHLKSVNLGYSCDRLLSFRVQPGLNGYQGFQLLTYYEDLQQQIAVLPGVEAVGISQNGPVGSGMSVGLAILPGFTEPGKNALVMKQWVNASYFQTLGIAIILGRQLSAADTATAQHVAVIDERFARDYFHGQNPLGRDVNLGGIRRPQMYTVVGIAANARYNYIRKDPPPTIYLSYQQAPNLPGAMTLLVRTRVNPAAVAAGIQEPAKKVNPQIPVTDLQSVSELVNKTLFVERMFAALSSSYSTFSLVLACLGIYSIVAYGVSQRTQEIGIRMALGATPADILGLIFKETLLIVFYGVAPGLLFAWYATQALKTQLFGLAPHDGLTLAATTLSITTVCMVAASIPAYRAARIHPIMALRHD